MRQLSLELCRPLAAEDFRIQSMPDVSPPWWNLGHTTWFFAKNILEPHTGYRVGADLDFALNSYYEAHGARVERSRRGTLTRPTTDEIFAFRTEVDELLDELLDDALTGVTRPRGLSPQQLQFLVTTGLQHEQQHQELLLTEILHILSVQPPGLRPAYAPPGGLQGRSDANGEPSPPRWVEVAEGMTEIGALSRWHWDNEAPRHRRFLEPFALRSRLVTNGEFLEFLSDGGYDDPLLWLANGWQARQEQNWNAPLYWRRDGSQWLHFTLRGEEPLPLHEPLAHVSFYEADAFATWCSHQSDDLEGARLPTEFEWETASALHVTERPTPNLLLDEPAERTLERSALSPLTCPRSAPSDGLAQMTGDVWEWTSSHYEPYPGYRPFGGDLMEYNGKFMDNQRVLRGGSCATPASHIRPSYRNFWHPTTRFQFTGLRLGRTGEP